MVSTSNMRLKFFLTGIIYLVLLRPHFDFGPPLLGVYFADGLILLLIFFMLLDNKVKVGRYQSQPILISLAYLFLMILPIIINLLLGNASFDLIFKYGILIYYILLFWIMSLLTLRVEHPYEFFSRLFDKCFNIIFVVALIQLLNPPLIGDLIRIIYGSAKLRNLYSGYPRIYSTFYNANWFGVYLIFYLGWINSIFISKKIPVKKYFLKLGLILLLLFSLGSRSALLGGSLIMLIQWFDYRYIRRVLKFLPALIILVPSLFIILKSSDLLEKTLNRFSTTWNLLLQVGFDMSVLEPGRWYAWMTVFERFKRNPLVGSGSSGELIPHNSYIYFLDTFGLIGASITVLCGFILIFSLRVRKGSSVESRISRKWFYSFMVSFGVMSISADYIFTTQVMLLFVLSASINYSFNYRETKALGENQ